MATAETDNYLQQIDAARTHIQECFKHTHDLLTLRKNNLLTQLDAIQSNYEHETKSRQEELNDLEVSKKFLQNNLRSNAPLNEALFALNRHMDQIMKLSSVARTISFQWNTDIEKYLENLGEIITTALDESAIPDYANKSIPDITCCTHSDNQNDSSVELYLPKGLAIEPQKGSIYIADMNNNRVQVFSSKGEYCFMFNHKMSQPWGICISRDTVYVSQWDSHYISYYNLDGTFIDKVGSYGSSAGQFNYPVGIAVSDYTGYLYVCDCSNHRVQIFNNSLQFHSMFGNEIVRYPGDVKLTNELDIVLDLRDTCIHLFSNRDHSLLNSIISRGAGKQIERSCFFAIDSEVNIILTDKDNHCVKVFNKSGDLITQFGKGQTEGDLIKPTGVAVDGQNRIVVVSQSKNAALQIF